MKSFKSIREGNYAEPGVSEIDDVPDDPMSFVEIKPKKTKVVKEGIVDSAANARVRIFSSIDRKKKELYKNAVKEDIQEAVTVKKEKYSWGNMMTVHHGSDTSFPLHPEHQQAIAKLGDGEKTSFKDETNSTVHAHREGDTVHLTRPRLSTTKTSVAHSHFNEETEQIDELNKDTLYSYAAKAEKDVDKRQKDINRHRKNNNPIDANKTMSKTMKRFDGMDRAETRLNKEEAEQGVAEETLSELKKSTLGSYVKKASDSAAMSAYGAGGESQRNATKAIVAKHYGEPVSKRPDTYGADRKVALKRLKGIGKATDRLTKEETVLETKGAPKGFHFTKDGKLKRGDADQDGNGGPMLRTDPLDKQRNKVPAVSEGIDFFKVWESIKPVEIVVEEEAVDPIILKREADILMTLHIAAHKAK